MTNENFFKHNDKAYTENINDAVLIANAFNFEVPLNLPSMYLSKHYPSNTNTYKAGVADVTIINSGQLSIGDTAITNNASSSQTLRLRVYPNFNSFYAWKSINWTCTGDVTVDICNTGTSTSLIPTGALTDPDNETLLNGISSLQGLKEYDLLITIPENGVLNTLNIVFINNRASENRVSASISQGNVAGLESSLDGLDTRLNTLEDNGVWNTVIGENSLYYIKKAGVVFLTGYVTPSSATSTVVLQSLPQGFRPTRTLHIPLLVYKNEDNTIDRARLEISSAGAMRIYAYSVDTSSFVIARKSIYIDTSFIAQ